MKLMLSQILQLIRKDALIEMRNKHAFGGLLLFSASTVMIIYFSLLYNGNALSQITPAVWSILLWLTILFSAVNAVASSFFREREENLIYYHFLFSPTVFIAAKIIYNIFFSLILTLVSGLIFMLMISNPIQNATLFFEIMMLGAISYSILFTLMSAIALKAKSDNTLVAVLGFPILIPMLIFITKTTSAALGAVEMQELANKNLLLLVALNFIQLVLAGVLFPYVWKE